MKCCASEGPIEHADETILLDAIFQGIIESADEFTKRQMEFERQSRLRAEEDLRRLNEEQTLRTQFISALAHDLRNPLSSMRLNAEVVMRAPDNRELLQRSLSNALSKTSRIAASSSTR